MKQRENRWWDLPAVLLFFATLLITSLRLEATDWAADLIILKWLTLTGYLLGLGLGYSYFKTATVRWLALGYTLLIVPWTMATTYEQGTPWLERASNLSGRLGITLGQFFNNIRIEDPILFITFLAILIWITAVLGGYLMTRNGRPWAALLISGITIFVTEFYYLSQRNLFTAVFVIFSLLLLSQTNFMHTARRWRKSGTLVEFETEFNIGRTALIGGIILVFVSWNVTTIISTFTPGSPQQQQLRGLFENIRNEFAKITAPLSGPLILQQEYYGESIGLGTGAVLGDDLVFEIEVDSFRPNGSRYYWRARTYDLYLDDQWRTTIENEIEYTANSEVFIDYPDADNFPERNFIFRPNINLGLIYTPAYPIELSRTAELIATRYENGLDLAAVSMERTIYSGESYEVRATIPDPTITEMREASTEYPEWLKQKYLQLPEDFPERIRLLAEEITADRETPYDKAFAITNYLRSTIQYQEQIPEPPRNADPIEWFLFEHQAGFCNYYATSQVLMLRSIGIPARMVFGYAQGEGSENDQFFTVQRKQSHAWPEVYFPGIGWVEFEPTAGQPVLTRLLGQPSLTNDFESREDDDPELNRLRLLELQQQLAELQSDDIREIDVPPVPENEFEPARWLPLLITIFMATAITLFVLRQRRLGKPFTVPIHLERFIEKRGWNPPEWLRRWSHYVKLPEYEKAFSSIAWALYIMQQPIPRSTTPAELVQEFSEAFPSLDVQAEELLVEYQKALYSPYPPQIDQMKENGRFIIRQALTLRFRQIFLSDETETAGSSY